MKTKEAPTQPIVIAPTAVFTIQSATAALGLARRTLSREIKLGRLQVSKRAGKYFLLGEWLIHWLEQGVIARRPVNQAPRVDHLANT